VPSASIGCFGDCLACCVLRVISVVACTAHVPRVQHTVADCTCRGGCQSRLHGSQATGLHHWLGGQPQGSELQGGGMLLAGGGCCAGWISLQSRRVAIGANAAGTRPASGIATLSGVSGAAQQSGRPMPLASSSGRWHAWPGRFAADIYDGATGCVLLCTLINELVKLD
jgi:hypothetical protein